ncbi:MAG: GNAT family N-acetyltransferase [Salibaculum sp.]|uniref:GNAT family N-acetyltransferase n=1 Tax=Salibaculum sp. TaxID=2855480 RepID=UPI002870623A|nr:GNAT family N-acetyltransferase [Salibaculum sp.]MDR9427540.1 GNAT family N-acetyltransferase [Salibaculum sp.]
MTQLHLCGPEDAARLMPLVAAFHGECGLELDDAHRARAVRPLLEGTPLGAVWLLGPRRAPVGCAVVSFGWSIETGGIDACLDTLYVRPAVRGRGLASQALTDLSGALRGAGVTRLQLEVLPGDEAGHRFFVRAGFTPREGHARMTRSL